MSREFTRVFSISRIPIVENNLELPGSAANIGYYLELWGISSPTLYCAAQNGNQCIYMRQHFCALQLPILPRIETHYREKFPAVIALGRTWRTLGAISPRRGESALLPPFLLRCTAYGDEIRNSDDPVLPADMHEAESFAPQKVYLLP
jgi:hypothetical protein